MKDYKIASAELQRILQSHHDSKASALYFIQTGINCIVEDDQTDSPKYELYSTMRELLEGLIISEYMKSNGFILVNGRYEKEGE